MQEIVDKTIMEADKDGDGKLSFEEFTNMVNNTVRTSAQSSSHYSAPPLPALFGLHVTAG